MPGIFKISANKNIWIAAYLSIFFISCAQAIAVPALPNKAAARGTVVEYCISSLPEGPDQRAGFALYRIVMKVETVEDIKGAPNFLVGKEGQKLSFWSRFRLDPKLFGKKVKAIVEYRGDERGGRYMLEKVEIVP